MSQATSKLIPLQDKEGAVFRGGIINNSEPNVIPYSNSPLAQNFRVNSGGISIRPGFYAFASLTGTGERPFGITTYNRATSSADRIIVGYKNDATHYLVSIDSDGNQTPVSTGSSISVQTKMNFLQSGDAVYCMNGVDSYGRLNGTTYTALSSTVNSITFSGSGLDDLSITSSGGTTHTFIVEIDATGTPDTFKWNVDGGAYTTGVAITGVNQALSNGMIIKFSATTGHTLASSWTLTQGFTPAFGVLFNNSGWVAGDPSNPTTLYKSATDNLDSYSGAGSDIFTTGLPITALGVNQQSLYVFTETTIDVFNVNSINQVGASLVYQSKPIETTEGASNHNVVVSVGKGIFYISSSNKVRKINPNSFQMYDFTEISHREGKGITKTMDTLSSDQTGWFGYAIPEKQVICWHVRTKDATYNNLVLVYNYEFDEWMIDTNKSFSGGTMFGIEAYTISAVNPTVFRDEFGDTDDDSPIQFRYDTKTLDFGEPTILKCLWQIRTYLSLNTRGKIYQNIYADGALVDSKLIDSSTIPQSVTGLGTSGIGTFAIGTEGNISDDLFNTIIVRDKGYLRIKATKFTISYISYDLGSKCMLQKVEPMVEVLNFLTTSHY